MVSQSWVARCTPILMFRSFYRQTLGKQCREEEKPQSNIAIVIRALNQILTFKNKTYLATMIFDSGLNLENQ